MALEEIKVKITADKTQVDGAFNDIKGTANKVEAESKKAATSIGSVISAVVGAAAVQQITSFFSSAIGKYNQLNAALMRVESTSKAVGQSIERNKKLVQELADQGFLTLTESANAFSDSISMGLDPTKAKKFVESLSDIAAVERTMGTLNEAVSSGISGLRSGSSERVENIGVSVKKLSQEYQINTQKLGQAAAMEKFYQGVIKESTKYRGEALKSVDSLAGAQTKYNAAVEKAQAAIGKGLEPVMKRLYAVGTQLADMFTKLLNNLDSTTVAAVAFGTTAFLAIASFSKGAALLPGIFGSIGGSIAAALGPIGLFIAGVSAVVVIIGKLRREWGESQTRSLLNERDALIQQIGALQNVAGKTKELNDAKAKLLELNKQITTNYAQYLKYLDAENLSIEKKIGLIDVLEKAEKRLTFDKDIRERSADELRAKAKELDAEIVRGNTLLAKGQISRARYDEELGKVVAERAIIGAALETKAGPAAMSSAASGGGKLNQVRFIEAQERLKEIEKARRDTERAARNDSSISNEERRRRIENAKENAKILAETEVGQLRQVYAEFIEDKYQADLEGLKRQENEAIASVRRQVEAGKLDKEKAEKMLQKIREKGIQKEAALAAKSMAETLQAANATASGLAQIRSGNVGGGIGAALQGISGFDKENSILQTAGFVGQGLSAIVGIGNAVSGFFGKSEEELQRIATEQKLRDEEALKILELQANYQKNMLALQEAAAKLPFEDLQRQMRLADIEAQQRKLFGEDAALVDADTRRAKLDLAQGTLTSQSGKIGEGIVFGGTGSTPDELIAFLSQRAAQSAAIGQFLQLLDVVGSNTLSPAQYAEVNAQLRSYKGKIPDELYNAARGTVINFDGTTSLQDENSLGYGGSRTEYADGIAITTIKGSAEKINAARRVASEISADTGIAENLLSVIEQSNSLQLEIAANTKKTADNTTKLAEGKGDAIVDIAAGGISQNGAFLQGGLLKYLMGKSTIDPSSLVLNPSIQNAILSSQVMESLDERMARGVDQLVSLNEREVDLLSIIAANLQSNPNPARDELRQQILDILEEFRSRS